MASPSAVRSSSSPALISTLRPRIPPVAMTNPETTPVASSRTSDSIVPASWPSLVRTVAPISNGMPRIAARSGPPQKTADALEQGPAFALHFGDQTLRIRNDLLERPRDRAPVLDREVRGDLVLVEDVDRPVGLHQDVDDEIAPRDAIVADLVDEPDVEVVRERPSGFQPVIDVVRPVGPEVARGVAALWEDHPADVPIAVELVADDRALPGLDEERAAREFLDRAIEPRLPLDDRAVF